MEWDAGNRSFSTHFLPLKPGISPGLFLFQDPVPEGFFRVFLELSGAARVLPEKVNPIPEVGHEGVLDAVWFSQGFWLVGGIFDIPGPDS
jgi:hypothetical protein